MAKYYIKQDAPPDAEEFEDVEGKFDKYFSPSPAKATERSESNGRAPQPWPSDRRTLTFSPTSIV